MNFIYKTHLHRFVLLYLMLAKEKLIKNQKKNKKGNKTTTTTNIVHSARMTKRINTALAPSFSRQKYFGCTVAITPHTFHIYIPNVLLVHRNFAICVWIFLHKLNIKQATKIQIDQLKSKREKGMLQAHTMQCARASQDRKIEIKILASHLSLKSIIIEIIDHICSIFYDLNVKKRKKMMKIKHIPCEKLTYELIWKF